LVAIYRASNGYPRKIINLCHHCILAMIIQNRTKVSYSLVRSCVKRIFPKETWRWRRITATAGVALVIAAVIFALQMPGQLTSLLPDKITQNRANIQQQENFDSNDLKAHQVNMQSKKNPPLHEPVTPSETSATVTSEPVSTDTQMIATAAPLAATQRPIEPITDNPIASEYAYQALEDERQTKEPYDQILGNVTLKRNETLSLIIQKVYGIYNSKYFRSLILANPEIDDPDLVKVGQIIYLPAIPASVKPLNTKVWWILVQEKDTLEAAFDYVRSYPAQAPPARLVPYWNHQSGTRFAVVLKTYFYDQASALRQLNQLPLSLSAAGKVLSLWNEKTVFFADPFAGGRHLAKFKVKRD
jgi:general secretion pathway protein A